MNGNTIDVYFRDIRNDGTSMLLSNLYSPAAMQQALIRHCKISFIFAKHFSLPFFFC